jgi:ArsR family transcriptional regulator
MNEVYKENAQLFKALSDPNRLMIVDMLSCGELCACVILEKFHITQPTLSHHMKNLCECNLVNWRKEGKWTYYSLNDETVKDLKAFMDEVTSAKRNCICFAEAVGVVAAMEAEETTGAIKCKKENCI